MLTPLKERFLSLCACTSHRQVSNDNGRLFSYPSQKYRVKAIFLEGTLAVTDERLNETEETSSLFDLVPNVLDFFVEKIYARQTTNVRVALVCVVNREREREGKDVIRLITLSVGPTLIKSGK